MSDKAPSVELPSALFGRWRRGQLLGEGGQGKVYLLHSESGAPDAVIKFLHSEKPYDVERFRREVGALATIDHPNVMRVVEHGMEPVPFYVASKGEPLNKYWKEIRRSAKPSELFERSAILVEQLAKGLAAVHAKKLVHRDIKPANVIMMATDVPVLADFGIVHVPEADRITDRPAGNRFARDLAAFYDPSLALPHGDCLCLANLWAWMLASVPQLQHGNYHWRFHKFVDDERCDVARAVLALCSEPSVCPKDGDAFVALLEKRFNLPKLRDASLEDGASAKAYAVAAAESETTKVALRSEIDVLALAILPALQPLVSTLRSSAERLTSQGLPAHLHVTGISDPLKHDEVLSAIASTEKERIPHQLTHLTCGDDRTLDFGVKLHIEWHNYPHEDGSKFSLHVIFFHEGSPEVHAVSSRYHKVLPNGDIEDFEPDVVAARVRDFFQDSRMWRPRTEPRPRVRGSFLG
jgi:hypothetical protein